MSSPIDRSSDPDEVLHYAPKWARDRDNAYGQRVGPQLPLAGGEETVTMVPADSPDFESERFRHPRSLAPSPIPQPPIRENWWRDSTHSLARSGRGGSAIFPFVLAVFLAALIAFFIVAEWPKIQNFVAKQLAPNSFAVRFGGDPPKAVAGSGILAGDPRPASAERSNSAPIAEPRTAANPAATASVVRLSPVRPTQPAFATSTPTNPAPATSPPANPAPAVAAPPPASAAPANPAPASSLAANSAPAAVAPPAADVATSAASVPVASVKTVPVQPEKPVRALGPEEIKTLLKQGEDFVSVGDFASARLVFGRVWEANEARGALAFAATYDPVVLARIGAKGATPDAAKAREWYLKAGELGSPDAALRLDALASRNFAIPTQKSAAMALTGKEAPNEAASQNSLPGEAPVPAGSYWQHGGSIMRLEAIGISRKFFFYKPSDAELEAGAKAEALRFDGQISGKGYTGTAFLYSDKCGRSAFQVSGQIENNDGRVILSGRSPQVDRDCREIGRSDQQLVFDLMATPPK